MAASLPVDVLGRVAEFTADEAGTYFVCWRWSRILRARFGEYAGYERFVGAGLRLALATGDWSGYRVTLSWFGVRSFTLVPLRKERFVDSPSGDPVLCRDFPQAAVRGTPDEDICPTLEASHAFCELHNDLTTPGAEVRVIEAGDAPLCLSETPSAGPLYETKIPEPGPEATDAGLTLESDSVPIALETPVAASASLVAAITLSPNTLGARQDAPSLARAAEDEWRDLALGELGSGAYYGYLLGRTAVRRASLARETIGGLDDGHDEDNYSRVLGAGDGSTPHRLDWVVLADEAEARATTATLRARGARVSVENATDAFKDGDLHEVLKACMVAGFLDGDDSDPVWAAESRRLAHQPHAGEGAATPLEPS